MGHIYYNNNKTKETSQTTKITLVSTCVAQLAEKRTIDLNVTGSSPLVATRHIRYALLINSPNNLNLLSWLFIYLCNK